MTAPFLSKKFLVSFLVFFLIAGILFVKKDDLFLDKFINPLRSRDLIAVLSQNLEVVGLTPTQLTVVDSDTIQASISGTTVTFSPSKDFSQQVRALQLVLSRRTIESAPKVIDLRFNNVVVRY